MCIVCCSGRYLGVGVSAWGVSAWGDVCPGGCLPRGCLPGGCEEGVSVRLSPCEQNDRHVLKHYLATTTLRTVNIHHSWKSYWEWLLYLLPSTKLLFANVKCRLAPPPTPVYNSPPYLIWACIPCLNPVNLREIMGCMPM